MGEASDSRTWTVFSVRDVFSGEVHVVGVVPGDQTGVAVCPSGDALIPEVQAVVASSAWEVAGLIAYGSDDPDDVAPPLTSTALCRNCARFEGTASMALRNALGHDKFGHRLSNTLSRAGVTSIAELRLVSDATLLELRDFGLAGLQRVRSARLRRVPHVSH